MASPIIENIPVAYRPCAHSSQPTCHCCREIVLISARIASLNEDIKMLAEVYRAQSKRFDQLLEIISTVEIEAASQRPELFRPESAEELGSFVITRSLEKLMLARY